MTNLNLPSVGTIINVPVQVSSIWTHTTTILTGIGAAIPVILGVLYILKDIPGIPSSWLVYIMMAISVLVAVGTILHKLFGTPDVTPTQSVKLINKNS